MASTAKCPFCGAVVTSDQKQCPECGSKNEHYVEDSPRRIMNPRTIEELKEYCAERGMPLLRMRFFVGEDFREPKAFGIYRDGNSFIVYKNKADGSRAIRYSGPDEAYAVKELHEKLLSECYNRGIYPDGKPAGLSARQLPAAGTVQGRPRKNNSLKQKIGRIITLAVIAVITGLAIHSKIEESENSKPISRGYYLCSNAYYYTETTDYYYGQWYSYDGTGWTKSERPDIGSRAIRRGYLGEAVQPEWNIRAIPLHEKPEKGYYLFENICYCGGSYRWMEFDPAKDSWVRMSDSKVEQDEKGRLRYCSDDYAGTEYSADWPGFDYLSGKGYYRVGEETWYYSGECWHLYDGKGWKKAIHPVPDTANYYQGDAARDEWQVRAFPAGSPAEGYYRLNGVAYYYGSEVGSRSKWAEYDPGKQRWGYSGGFPAYDAEGYAVFPEDCYGGTSFPPEWEGHDYIIREGYYRWQDATYYYSEINPVRLYDPLEKNSGQMFLYDHGWKRCDVPVGNIGEYYAGKDTKDEWECTAFRLPGRPEPGYYRYDGTLYYAVKASGGTQELFSTADDSLNPWRHCLGSSWMVAQFPTYDTDGYLIDPQDYYAGAEYEARWGGSRYHTGRGYYRYNGAIYYSDGISWYRYNSYGSTRSWSAASRISDDWSDYYIGDSMPAGGKSYTTWQQEKQEREQERTRYESDWSSSDYDSWDSSDTDWDSDW